MKKLIIALLFISLNIVWAASPDQLLKGGIALRDAGNIDQAILKFQELLKSKPKHSGANFELGKSYLMKSDCENSIKFLKNALKFGYNELKAHLALAQAYQTCGNHTEASIEYQLVLELNPHSAEIHTLLGNIHRDGGNATLGEEEYKKALQLDTSYVPALFGLAELYQDKRQYEEALNFYNKAKSVNPNHAPTYLALGSFYVGQKKYENSITELTKYIQLEPKDSRGYTKLADVYSRMKDYNSAINEMCKAVDYGDSTVGSLKFLCLLYNQAGMTLQEKDVLMKIVAKDSTDGYSWLSIAKICSKIDSFPSAIYAYNRALSLDSTILPNIVFKLGLAYYQVAKYDSAEQMFSKKIELDTLAAGAYFNRGLARMQVKKYKEAIGDLEKGLQIKPDHIQGHLWLAQLYAFLDMKQKAKVECNTLLKLDPENKEAKELLSNLTQPTPKQPTYEDYWDYEDEENQ